MALHPRTRATLERLEKAKWFASVGVVDTDAAIVVTSWDDAIAQCSSLEWENLCLEAVNQYCMRIVEAAPKRFEQWNQIVREVQSVTFPFVQRKIAEVVRENELPQVFEDTVQWDIAHVCMEAEYADVYPPGYYASQAFWYAKGHFPCGWRGQFPAGQLIIY